MAAVCILAGGKTLSLAVAAFSLAWTHSVEKVEWREDWRVGADGLSISRAAVKGSGAGMEPGDGAVLEDGWWVWTPDLPAVPKLVLAASGATPSAWQLCHEQDCMALGAQAGEPVVIEPCR